MPRRLIPICAGSYYHLYNRGVNRGSIFFNEDNYEFFLYNIRRYLLPVVEITAYCLMPNHFHLLIFPKETSEIGVISEVSSAMMRLSVSYTKTINHRFDRVGPLFQGAFQSKYIDTSTYLWQIIGYIHLNPVEAGLVKSPGDWLYSSWRSYQKINVPDLLPTRPAIDLRGL
jgi:REP element-mobilizing transposase RayT